MSEYDPNLPPQEPRPTSGPPSSPFFETRGAPPPPTIVVQAPPTGGRTALFWVAAALLFFLLGSVAINLVLMIALVASAGEVTQGPDRLIEKELEPAAGPTSNKIAVLEVEGIITDSAVVDLFGGASRSTVDQVHTFLRRAARDPDVKGVLLEIDSPGGGVTASELIHREILEFRKETGGTKPIVALMMDMAASGGYYIAAPCDAIFAHETTITGSIGVILSFFDVTALGEKIGIEEVVIASGDNKAIANPFKKMTPEQREILEGLVRQMYERFVTVVDEGRPNLTKEEIYPLADGRIYTGAQAAANGLVDQVGYFDDAIEEIKKRAKITDAKIVTYRGEPTLTDLLTGNVRARRVPDRVELALPGVDLSRAPRFQYLWRMPSTSR